jgi:hypothetical protein
VQGENNEDKKAVRRNKCLKIISTIRAHWERHWLGDFKHSLEATLMRQRCPILPQ